MVCGGAKPAVSTSSMWRVKFAPLPQPPVSVYGMALSIFSGTGQASHGMLTKQVESVFSGVV